VAEGLHRIFGSVYDGDPTPLQRVIEDENVNEYVRNAAIDAFIVLAQLGQMSREDVVAYYRSLFQGKLQRTFSHAWNGLATAVAELPAPELLEDVRQAYREELIESGFADLETVERMVLPRTEAIGKSSRSSRTPSKRWIGGIASTKTNPGPSNHYSLSFHPPRRPAANRRLQPRPVPRPRLGR
jgi:Protein of unknown function (DUF1186)